jgi:Na+/H+ antiporter NhaD/arsenite permease-like protein
MMIYSWAGYLAVIIFILAYLLVIFEEKTEMRKSKPVLLGGCLIWLVIGVYEVNHGKSHAHNFMESLIAEIGALFFFLMVAMTIINALDERNVFKVLRVWLVNKGFGFRQLFWVTGGIAFILSPMADNMATGLLMASVALAVSDGNRKFILPTFVNIVVAANAGGAWSPFGDITTLMIWVDGKVKTQNFLCLVGPSLINWLVPALIMYPFVPKLHPAPNHEELSLKPGAGLIILLFLFTIATAVSFHHFLDLPPFLGMMMGLAGLMLTSYYPVRWDKKLALKSVGADVVVSPREGFNIFRIIEKVEFDTLLFFFGILISVEALQYLGYLVLLSNELYGTLGFTCSNIIIGVLSAVVDNIPLTFAVLKMDPSMGLDQWLLITLTAGVGGSLLSIGSAAGVAAMGVDRENYSFFNHLKWTPAIFVGYVASIGCWWLFLRGAL